MGIYARELESFGALELWQVFVFGEDASRKDGLLTGCSNLAYIASDMWEYKGRGMPAFV